MASLELMRGPPRNRASRSLILSMAVVMATASEVVMILLVVEVATTAEEEEVAEFAIPFDVAFVVLFVVAEFVDIFFFGRSTIDFASFFLAF